MGRGPHPGPLPSANRLRPPSEAHQGGLSLLELPKREAGIPGYLPRARKVSQLFPAFFLPPHRRRPCFRPSQAPGQTRWAHIPVFRPSSLASVSPSSQKPRTVTSRGRGRRVGGRSKQRGLLEEGDLERSGPCSFSQPRSPLLPSPARHLSRPDNGTSAGRACAVSPGPSAGGGAGALGRGRGATRLGA